MDLNREKVANLVRMVDALLSIDNKNTIDNEDIIDQTISKAISLVQIAFEEEEIAATKRDIQCKYKVYSSPGESIVANYHQEDWYSNKIDGLEQRFWIRYKNYLIDEIGFSPNVVSVLGEDTLDLKLMNYIGDPSSAESFMRRGLIIGDVQSGKTSTYIGLMCKAADAGYKVFMLLTGTIESLRRQTQERVEEGFIGIDMTGDARSGRRVGVGLDNQEIYAMAMTSRSSDFTGDLDKIAVSLKNHNAVVLVVKKNTNVLKKMKDWLISLNADPISGKIDLPMILIDDEADNASINTNIENEDPTRINRLIRELVDVFSKSNYVGFTATPFANVFIDPRTTDDMENHDLFPEDFIVALPTPSNYIGPSDIFSEDGRYNKQLLFVTDAGRQKEDGYPFYFKHRKGWDDELPDSLTDALYTFYLANAIRDLRGDKQAHRSMLINISRFVAVQYVIKSKVEELHKSAYRAIKFNLSNSFEESMKDPIIKKIYEQWKQNYKELEFSWETVANTLFDSIESIQIRVVNSKNSEKLEYPNGSSLRVIAIGGLALSRGLTLEGLIISYFFRNTSTYDVLMQMGRWFGYRHGYDDLFRIWTHADSAKWYAEIAESTNKLKDDMSIMREQGSKPKDFGIRVRNDSNELNITARNKMRNAKDEYEFFSYFGGHIETPYLHANPAVHKRNFKVISLFLEDFVTNNSLEQKRYKGSGENYIIKNIPKIKIINLLKQLTISRFSSSFDTKQIMEFLDNCSETQLDKWDVAIMEGNRVDDNALILHNKLFYKVARKTSLIDSVSNRLSIGRKGKLGGPNDGLMGVEDEELVLNAKANYRKYYEDNHPGELFTEEKTYPSDTWFKYISKRNPLLFIYFVDVDNEEEPSDIMKEFRENMGNIPVTAFAIGMPKALKGDSVGKFKYKANRYYNWFEMDDVLAEVEEE